MLETALQELIEFLENASPMVWEVLLKQVYIDAVANIAWAIMLVVVCILLIKLIKYSHEKMEEDSYSSWEMGLWLGYIFAPAAGALAFGLLVSAAMRFANPEFYAIRYILYQISGG